MTADPTIDYEGLAQEAMRGVVRSVLTRAAKTGLPGEHHFYISFETEAPGVSLSKRLKEKYPREMTIVLQHRFWDLAVSDDRFEVKLTFDGIPERLVVPFQAVKVFFDPSVRFGLQFDDGSGAAPQGFDATPAAGAGRPEARGGTGPRKIPRQSRKARSAENEEAAEVSPASATGEDAASAKPQALPMRAPQKDVAAKISETSGAEQGEVDEAQAAEPVAKGGGAEIVSLDKFRKK